MNMPDDRRNWVNNLISVITPVYNAERYIAATIESALNQTYTNIEMILVDDCSRDRSAEIIRTYCRKHPNIVYHLQENNMGAAVARNTALQLAKGQYVAFLDSDDIWKPEKTARQLALMQEKKAPLSYTAIEMINENDTLIKGKREVHDQVDYRFLLKNTMLATSTMMIDRDQLGDFRMPLQRSGQDYATWLQLMRDGAIAYGIDDALVQYRISSGSLSSNKLKSIRQVWDIQVHQEGLSPAYVSLNTCCFIWNALKKYLV